MKQTHDITSAESLSPITKKVEVNKSTKNFSDIKKESNSEIENNQEIVPVEIESEYENIQTNSRDLPNSSTFSELMTKTFGSLMSSSNSVRKNASPTGPTLLGVPIYTLGGDKKRIRDTDYELTPANYKVLSLTGYTGKILNNESDISLMNNIMNDSGYVGDRHSKRKIFSTKVLPKTFADIQNKIFDETDLEGQGVKIIIPSNITDIYTRFQVLLGLKTSGHTDTLTEAINLIDEIYEGGEAQNKQQYRNALNKYQT